jgi:hypothetical protein
VTILLIGNPNIGIRDHPAGFSSVQPQMRHLPASQRQT